MRLIKLAYNRWAAIEESDNLYAVGTPAQIRKILEDEAGVPSTDIDMAEREFEKHDHNVADFGIAYRFIFTKREDAA